MQTILYYHWCQARFEAEGIPCPGQVVNLGKGATMPIRLLGVNSTGELVRFDNDGTGKLIAIVEEVNS